LKKAAKKKKPETSGAKEDDIYDDSVDDRTLML
jgi:hypothetical protein